HAVYRAIAHGEPLISRIVTLTGNVDNAGNWEVLIGTPVQDLLPLARPRPDTDRTLLGGPMMGFALPRLDVPIVKGSNCLISASPRLFPPAPPEQPCIRCTECAKACPAELQPFELYWFSRSKNFGKAQEYHLFDCIECGCCSYVCPAHIPLVDYFRFAKSEIWAREREKAAADQARERFEFRNFRQEREKAEKAAKLAAKAAETRAKLAESGGAESPPPAEAAAAEDPKKALIAAALARAKAQKAEIQPQNTDNLSPETQAEIADIEARRKALEASAATAPSADARTAASDTAATTPGAEPRP
ncbi:MAG: H+/Na+-translocating ferredoxin:NAD+ oxidoreductase subunit, partial [Rhodocyclaceae bacterium]|nr:H+/Na+-translocating ferredoxin:NAD+ oxidoreductase subunit [Rhodocyclaceae bacterium]